MKRVGSTALAAALLALTAASAAPQEVPEFLQQVAEKYYHPARAGLRDLEVIVRNPRFAKALADAVVRVSWKAGAPRADARIENYKPDLAPRVAELQRHLRKVAENVVPATIVELARRSEVTVRQEGELTHVLLTPRGGGDTLNQYWFDRDLRIVRSVSEVAVQGKPQRTDFDQVQIEERDGHYLVLQMKGASTTGAAVIRWEYEKVDGFWLPTKMVHTTGRDEEVTLFVDYKVNRGIADDRFAGE